MSFLRSVIADARPRKLTGKPLAGPSAITGWKSRGLDGNALGAEGESSSIPDRTSHLSKSLPIRKGTNDVNMSDALAFQGDNPHNQAIGDRGSNVESESSLSAPVDKSESILDQRNSIRINPVAFPEQQLRSEGAKASKAEESVVSQPVGTGILDSSRMDSSMSSDGPLKDTETLTTQVDATQTTALPLPISSRQIGSRMPETSLAPSIHSPDAFGHTTSDNPAERNEVEKALVNGGKASQVSPNVDKQAEMKSLSNQEETHRLQKRDEAKGVLRNVQSVSRQVTMDSQIYSDRELVPGPQSADKKASTLASPLDSGFSKSGSPVQHIARPARPSASQEALRSVPARPLQRDLMPKDDDSFHPSAPTRSPDKMQETPTVQIGQIDVIVETVAQPATKPAPASSSIDLASRHYLRRL